MLTVEDCHDTDLNAAVHPALYVLGSHFDISHSVMARPTTVFFHDRCTVPHDDFVFIVEEVGGFVVLRHEKDARRGPDNGDYAFDNVQPKIISA